MTRSMSIRVDIAWEGLPAQGTRSRQSLARKARMGTPKARASKSEVRNPLRSRMGTLGSMGASKSGNGMALGGN